MSTMRPQSRPGRIVFPLVPVLAVLLGGWGITACSVQAEDPQQGETGSAGTGEQPGEVLARVEGESITRAAVEESAAEELEQVRLELIQCRSNAEKKRHDVLEDTTRNMVRDRLLEAEAAERGITKDRLLAEEVEQQVAEVTEEDLQAFYEDNQARLGNQPLEQIAPQLRQYLRQQRETAAYQGFIEELEERYGVSYRIEPYRVDLDTEGEPSWGPEDAPVTLVEFSDFECPYCGRVVPTLERVKETYGDRVRIVFKQHPLRRIHPHAQKAAEASLCALEQGKFWELHDAMFADQEALTVEDLKAKAEEVGMDPEPFGECLESGRHAEAVEEDLRQGTVAGVSGTPALFVNGRMLSGAVPYDSIAELVDEELEGEAK